MKSARPNIETQKELLRIRDLTVGYDHDLFADLNLSLYAKNLVCFMGPNGAGKSTLLRTIGGLQKPLRGEVLNTGGNIAESAPHKQIAMVLTDPVRDINITVFEAVSFGRYPYLNWNVELRKKDREIIAHAIDQVNIPHLQNRKLHQLSDGQLQMTMIARALAQDTPIILLDEPTAHLDLNNRVEIMKLLRSLARDMQKAILLATHELDLALQTADLIWLTGKNKNIVTGIPEDLVLDGSFDQTFQFKGFDLKTGKVQHEVFQKFPIRLKGEGYPFLWTKNALERNGFQVKGDPGGVEVAVVGSEASTTWYMGDDKAFPSLRLLLDYLLKLPG